MWLVHDHHGRNHSRQTGTGAVAESSYLIHKAHQKDSRIGPGLGFWNLKALPPSGTPPPMRPQLLILLEQSAKIQHSNMSLGGPFIFKPRQGPSSFLCLRTALLLIFSGLNSVVTVTDLAGKISPPYRQSWKCISHCYPCLSSNFTVL